MNTANLVISTTQTGRYAQKNCIKQIKKCFFSSSLRQLEQIFHLHSVESQDVIFLSSVWFQLNEEMSKVITKVLDNYPGNNSTTEQAWDFIQRNVSRTHWSGVRFRLISITALRNFSKYKHEAHTHLALILIQSATHRPQQTYDS